MKTTSNRILLAGFIGALVLLGGVTWLDWRHINQMQAAVELVSHTHEVRASLNRLLLVLADIETGARGFVITGDPTFLEPFESGLKTVVDEQRKLESLIRDAQQRANLSVLEPLITERIVLAQRNVDLRKAGGFEAVRQAVARGRGKTVMDQIRVQLARMDALEQALLERRSVAARRESNRVRLLIFTVTGLSFALLIGVFALVMRENRLRREVESSLQASESLIRTVLNSVMANIAVVDRHGTIIAINERWERFARENGAEASVFAMGVGVNYLEVCARTARDLGAEGAIVNGLRGVLAHSQPAFNYEYPCHSPTEERWFTMHVSPLERADGGAVIAHINITERKRAEAELETVNQRMRLVLDSTGDGIYGIGTDGHCMFINRSALALLGYASPEEVLGRNNHDLWHHSHADGSPYAVSECPIYQALRGQHKKPVATEVFWRKDGTSIPVEYTALPINDGGQVVGCVVNFTDITERKAAEESVRRLNAELEQRAFQLQAANKELEAFSYSVSHDLRTPLRAIDGFSRFLQEDYGDKLDAPGRDHLHEVRAASQRMGHLIDDLLNLSRITRGEMVRQPVNLSALAREVVAELRQREPDRVVETVIADGLAADGDPRLLRVALANLIGNAWKFTSKTPQARIEVGFLSGGSRSVATATMSAQPDGLDGARPSNGGPVFFVRDNGAGFDMAYAHKLFGAFQRLHDTNEFEGTGIGLATVQRIIHRHGGKVWAEGEVDKGATVYFNFHKEEQ